MRRNEIRINGKSLEQVELELLQPIPEEKVKYNDRGEPYFAAEAYEERLISVLGGRRFYNTVVNSLQINQVQGKYVAHTTVTIEILSDDNEVVWKKGASGGSNIIFLKSSGEAKSLKSDAKSAITEAYKNAYQQFGIGIEQLRQWKGNDRTQGKGINKDSTKTQEEQKYRVEFMGHLNSMNGRYCADVQLLDEKIKYQLVIFQQQVPEIEKYVSMSKFVNSYGKGTVLTFYGKKGNYRGKDQLIFRKPDLKK